MNEALEKKIRFRTDVARLQSNAAAGVSSKLMVKESPEYDGRAGELFPIVLTNLFLTFITGGIYRFWAKTRVRRYFLSRVSFLGDRLEYTGTGKELFLGFLVVLAILVPLYIGFELLMNFAIGAGMTTVIAVQAGYVLFFYFLFNVAVYRAQRYRLSRTQWRGIRGGQTGSAMSYAVRAIGWSFITVMTLGLAYPMMRLQLQAYKTDHMSFGDENFTFDGEVGPLFKYWVPTWLCFAAFVIPIVLFYMEIDYAGLMAGTAAAPVFTDAHYTLAAVAAAGFVLFLIMQFWYRAAEIRHFADCTQFQQLRFETTLGGWQIFLPHLFYGAILLLLIFGASMLSVWMVKGMLTAGQSAEAMQAIGTIVTVGVVLIALVIAGTLHPIIVQNMLFRVFCRAMTIHGTFSPDALLQNQLNIPTRGEGLADALDIDAF